MASIRKRKNRWQVQVRRKGCPPETRSFSHKSDAQIWAREIELTIDRHGLPISKKLMRSLTLGMLLQRYLLEITPAKKSHEKETYRIKKLLKCDFVNLSLDYLRPHHFAKFRDDRLKRVGSQTVRHDLNVLSNVFSVAMRDWGYMLPNNPLSGLDKPEISKSRDRRISRLEFSCIVSAAMDVAPNYLPDLLIWLVETAMRKGEALRVTQCDFDSERKTILVSESKNGQSRRIPLSPAAIEIVERRFSTGLNFLFPVSVSLVRSHWNRVSKKCKLNNLHLHDFRHEGISTMFEKGLSVPEVASISGHKDFRQLARYAHANTDLVRAKLGATFKLMEQ